MREGWVRVALGDVFELDNAKLGEHLEEPQVFSLSKYDGVVLASEYFDKRIASANLDGYKTLQPGEWAYSTIHVDEGSIARNNHGTVGVLSPMYTTMRWTGDEHDPQYFEVLLRSPAMLAAYRDNAQGSVNRRRSLPFRTFATLQVEVPPLEQQERVVDLLRSADAAHSAADSVWRESGRVLAAVRDELVTGPPVKLREMNVVIDGGKSPVTEGRPPAPGERAVLKLSAVRGGRFVSTEAKAVNDDVELPESALVSVGDVVITRSNTPEKVGDVALVTEDYPGLYLSDLTLRLRTDDPRVRPEWLCHALLTTSARKMVTSSASGTSSSMKKISRTKIREYVIPVPSLDVQDRVLRLLSEAQDAVQCAEVTLDRIRDLRLALAGELLAGRRILGPEYVARIQDAS